jgi:hypothetical protein
MVFYGYIDVNVITHRCAYDHQAGNSAAMASVRLSDLLALALSVWWRPAPLVPTIVFHGDQDTTVNPCNGDHVIAQQRISADRQTTVQQGQAPGGHAYSCTVYAGARGETIYLIVPAFRPE